MPPTRSAGWPPRGSTGRRLSSKPSSGTRPLAHEDDQEDPVPGVAQANSGRQRQDVARARRPERVTDRDRAAVGVDGALRLAPALPFFEHAIGLAVRFTVPGKPTRSSEVNEPLQLRG